MKTSTTKPRCVLLDANVVIESHELGVWEELRAGYRLTVPATVSRREALFYFAGRRKVRVDLPGQIRRSDIDELEASVEELADLYGTFESWFLDTLDPGELEALALLKAGRATGCSFCTSDAPAIKALVMLGMSNWGVSLETLLSRIGLTKKFKTQFQESFFKSCCRQGSLNLVTRDGLREKRLG